MEGYLTDICPFVVDAAAVSLATACVFAAVQWALGKCRRLGVAVQRVSASAICALSMFALALLPTVAKRAGTTGGGLSAPASVIAARAGEAHLRGSGAPAASAPWFTDISPTPTSVWLGVAWEGAAFAAAPFVEFYARTNLCAGIWEPIGWAEAAAGETNNSVEV